MNALNSEAWAAGKNPGLLCGWVAETQLLELSLVPQDLH